MQHARSSRVRNLRENNHSRQSSGNPVSERLKPTDARLINERALPKVGSGQYWAQLKLDNQSPGLYAAGRTLTYRDHQGPLSLRSHDLTNIAQQCSTQRRMSPAAIPSVTRKTRNSKGSNRFLECQLIRFDPGLKGRQLWILAV